MRYYTIIPFVLLITVVFNFCGGRPARQDDEAPQVVEQPTQATAADIALIEAKSDASYGTVALTVLVKNNSIQDVDLLTLQAVFTAEDGTIYGTTTGVTDYLPAGRQGWVRMYPQSVDGAFNYKVTVKKVRFK